jgi:hypothetical protein
VEKIMLKSSFVLSAALFSAALLLIGSSAVAQRAASERPVRACLADAKKNCANVDPGEGRIAGCIKEHMKDLSAPCQNLLSRAAAAKEACAADVKQKCADTRRRRAKIACIKNALADLSDACKSAISEVAAGKR